MGNSETSKQEFKTWMCLICGWVYDEAAGLPDEGIAPGTLVWPTRGVAGHGADPMFMPEGHTRTYAEMPESEKNAISHRARSFKLLMDRCFR